MDYYYHLSWYQPKSDYGCGIIPCSRDVKANQVNKEVGEIIDNGAYGIKMEVIKNDGVAQTLRRKA